MSELITNVELSETELVYLVTAARLVIKVLEGMALSHGDYNTADIAAVFQAQDKLQIALRELRWKK